MPNVKMCPKFSAAFALLGKRWTGLILRAMLLGQHRFSEIVATVPSLSDRMLAERLKELEAVGIVKRSVYPDVPVRVEYVLTPKGRDLEPVMDAVQSWANKWYGSPEEDEASL